MLGNAHVKILRNQLTGVVCKLQHWDLFPGPRNQGRQRSISGGEVYAEQLLIWQI